MLYDNALLARAYLQAFEATGARRHAEVAASTLDYLVRELRLPHGGYASATDADTDGVEGSTFVWTPAEVRELLGDDAALVEALYDITPTGNFEGATVLSRVLDLDEASTRSGVPAERLPELRRRMLEARALRPQPALDDKALASWNGMALAALAEGARVLDRPDLLEAAEQCAEFLLGPLSRPDGSLWRSHRAGRSSVPGFLDDHAQVAEGLWQLHRATLDPRWLAEARRLALLADERFSDPDAPGWYDTAAGGEELVARPRTLDDAPTPSGASTLAGLLVRLARLAGDDALEARVRAVVADAGDLPARAADRLRERPVRRQPRCSPTSRPLRSPVAPTIPRPVRSVARRSRRRDPRRSSGSIPPVSPGPTSRPPPTSAAGTRAFHRCWARTSCVPS